MSRQNEYCFLFAACRSTEGWSVMVSIRARAPLRISFAGGGTDVAPYPQTEGGAVLSATISRFAYGSLTTRDDDVVRVESVDLGVTEEFHADTAVEPTAASALSQAAVNRLARRSGGGSQPGFNIVLDSNAPPGSGLGSSSTLMVTLVGLLQEYHGLALGDYEIADLAHSIERVDLGIAGGLQDQYAATFGGFNYIEFGERVVVNPLRVQDWIQHELEMSLLLCFTGTTRQSKRIIADQTARVEAGEQETMEGLRAQKRLAGEMKGLLLTGRLREFGCTLDEAWKQKRRMSPHIATPAIDEAYEAAIKAGALGGKVIGAGGGGFLLFFCDFPKRHLVAEALAKMGMLPSEITFEPKGLQTWRH